MQQLTNAEEQLMEHLWKEKAFMKDLLESFPEPNQDHYRGHF
jgi:predicted transcriptional regulator